MFALNSYGGKAKSGMNLGIITEVKMTGYQLLPIIFIWHLSLNFILLTEIFFCASKMWQELAHICA